METLTKSDQIMELLPKLDCGACGYKTCEDFVTVVEQDEDELKKCIHITEKIKSNTATKNAIDRIAKSHEGFIDIGYYVSQAYEGVIKESKIPIKLGQRFWFLPRRCMLQWRYSGLVNAITRMKDGNLKVRIEGLYIG